MSLWSSLANNCPFFTRSPTLTLRSVMRPLVRKLSRVSAPDFEVPLKVRVWSPPRRKTSLDFTGFTGASGTVSPPLLQLAMYKPINSTGIYRRIFILGRLASCSLKIVPSDLGMPCCSLAWTTVSRSRCCFPSG